MNRTALIINSVPFEKKYTNMDPDPRNVQIDDYERIQYRSTSLWGYM